jgi:serine/threonine-protein phosphatase 6 regulatory ankyrin repeat subunit B
MIPLLLNHSAELDAEDNQGITPFFMAAYSGNYDGFKLLLEKGANLNHKTKDGATALHFAATPEIAEFLIKNNFDVNVRDNNGLTPLHYAVECTCIDQYTHLYTKKGKDYRVLVDVVKFLLDSGADVNARDNNGTQPLDCAEGNGDSIFTKILKERGAKQSSTPYKKACADK